MKVPAICHAEREWWEYVGKHVVCRRRISRQEISFVIERTKPGFVHACTLDDICRVLGAIPENDLRSLEMIVLRQSTQKQLSQSPTWGRLAYSARLGEPGKRAIYFGPAIFLEAINPSLVWRWHRSMTPIESAELDRLRADGHHLVNRANYFEVRSDLNAVRTTQLYRTLLHEIGHWVHLQRALQPAENDTDLAERLEDLYFSRPDREREEFAHGYAESTRRRLVARHVIPFPRLINSESMRLERLTVEDFIPGASAL